MGRMEGSVETLRIRTTDKVSILIGGRGRREIGKLSILEFKLNISLEIWDNIFENRDVNILFNCFLNTHLSLCYASFPLKLPKSRKNSREWITPTINKQCSQK